MGIPQESAFAETIRALGECNAAYLKPAFTREMFADENSVMGRKLISIAMDSQGASVARLQDDVVYTWLFSQPPFVRVIEGVAGRPTESRDDEDKRHNMRVERWHHLLHNAAFNESRRGLQRFEQRVDAVLGKSDTSYLSWLTTVVRALREYHFSNSASDIIENRRRYLDKIRASIAGLESLSELTRDQAIVNRFSTIQALDTSTVALLDAEHERRLTLLRSMASTDLDTMYPIARLDDTARERIFVFRVARANYATWGKYRAGSIASLMEIEGFRTQLDERTIERQCAGIERKKRRLLEDKSLSSVTT